MAGRDSAGWVGLDETESQREDWARPNPIVQAKILGLDPEAMGNHWRLQTERCHSLTAGQKRTG